MKQLTDLNQIIGKTIQSVTLGEDVKNSVLFDEEDLIIKFLNEEFIIISSFVENKREDYYKSYIDIREALNVNSKYRIKLLNLGIFSEDEMNVLPEDQKEQEKKRGKEKSEVIKELKELNRLMKKHGYIYGGSK